MVMCDNNFGGIDMRVLDEAGGVEGKKTAESREGVRALVEVIVGAGLGQRDFEPCTNVSMRANAPRKHLEVAVHPAPLISETPFSTTSLPTFPVMIET
jgi:hypothetical protein